MNRQIKYANETHRVIIESLNGITIKNPIMLTANQFEDCYSVSVNFEHTGVHIKKSDIDEQEIREIPDEPYQIILNRIWEANL
jgi:hypothetical protein